MEMRYRLGYKDGSGKDTIVDTQTDHAVAVTNWGCGCCYFEPDEEQIARAAKIVNALNAQEDACKS